MPCSTSAKIHREEYGSGPTVVLGHGFGGSSRNFLPQARDLSLAYRFVLFDARGHARSEAPERPEDYEPGCFVEDLHRTVTAGADATAVVGGLSMGAGIALRYALRHPEYVRALVLAAFPRPGSDPAQHAWAMAFADALDSEGLERAGAAYVWGDASRFDPRARALIRQGFLEHSPRALAHILRRLIGVQPAVSEMSRELRRLDLPVLVIAGSLDTGSLDPSHDLVRSLPRAELVIIEGAGHVVNLADREAFNGVLRRFLERI